MRRIIISSSVIGTILTCNVVTADKDVKISKVTNLADSKEYTFDITNAILDSTKKKSNYILFRLKMSKTTNETKEQLQKQIKDLTKEYFISAIKEKDTVGGFIEYKEGTGFQSGKQYEIYIDKIKKLDAGKLNILGGSNKEIANINSYKAYQLSKKESITEKELLEFIKNIQDNFNVIEPDKLYIDDFKINNTPANLKGKDFNAAGKVILNNILLNNKVEIETQHLKDKINISIKDEDLFDVDKLNNAANFENIKKYLKTLSTGRHTDENPDYKTFLGVIRSMDDKLIPIDLKIKIDESVYKTLDGNTAFKTGKQYTIKFPDDFYKKDIPTPTTTNIKVKFVAKEGFKLKGLTADKTVKLTNLTVQDLITAINNEINDLNLALDGNFIISIADFAGNVKLTTAINANKLVTITINKGKYIEEIKEKDPNQNPNPGEEQKQNQQQDQKQVKNNKKKCSNYK